MSALNSTDLEALGRAQKLLTDALKIIDKTSVPGDIGAHIDLACERLKAYLGRDLTPG